MLVLRRVLAMRTLSLQGCLGGLSFTYAEGTVHFLILSPPGAIAASPRAGETNLDS